MTAGKGRPYEVYFNFYKDERDGEGAVPYEPRTDRVVGADIIRPHWYGANHNGRLVIAPTSSVLVW